MSTATSSAAAAVSATTTWQVVPRGFFAREYALVCDGQEVAALRLAMLKEACEFELGGHQFSLRRKSVWKDGFEFSCDGSLVCTVSHAFWSWRYEITAGYQAWTLQRAKWLTRRYQLVSGEQEVGAVQPAGWFTTKRIAQFADSVPLPIQVLVILMVLIIARRDQQSSGV